MFLPPQGFRHAATLLLINSVRAIPADAAPEAIAVALERLAHELVALTDDMRAHWSVREWLINEFNITIDRLPHVFDRDRTKSTASAILTSAPARTPDIETRDL